MFLIKPFDPFTTPKVCAVFSLHLLLFSVNEYKAASDGLKWRGGQMTSRSLTQPIRESFCIHSQNAELHVNGGALLKRTVLYEIGSLSCAWNPRSVYS